jgi:hypothetical protein
MSEQLTYKVDRDGEWVSMHSYRELEAKYSRHKEECQTCHEESNEVYWGECANCMKTRIDRLEAENAALKARIKELEHALFIAENGEPYDL